ncbi:hypothetical protein LIER_17877 [Lithospermum erythrorhizon]|uniref:Retrovirus-related Pol polyprotein from transposon TNT 1-94-like beta-barrel domain-containing protein n=1 Tax=Lithospermum erythrorhizon TaxID=34254 RepID=A0AAV3QBZ5_LITER
MKRDRTKRKGSASGSTVSQSSYRGKSTGGNKNFTAMISEINMIREDNDWWVDSGATRHVCKDKSSFKTYELVQQPTFLYNGDKSQVDVLGKGSVVLEFTSRKCLTLNDVYHSPALSKNLMSGYLLNQFYQVYLLRSKDEVLDNFKVFKTEVELHCEAFIKCLRIRGHENVHNEHDSPSGETSQVRISKRARTSKDFGTDYFMFLVEGGRETKSVNSYVLYCYNLDSDPVTFDEAMISLDAPFRKEAIDDEMDSIMGNRVWKLASLRPWCKPVGYVKTTFLNGELDEEVYMEQPEGFIVPGKEHKV